MKTMKHYNAQSNDYNNLKKFMSKKITPSRVKPTLQVSRAILVALAMVGWGPVVSGQTITNDGGTNNSYYNLNNDYTTPNGLTELRFRLNDYTGVGEQWGLQASQTTAANPSYFEFNHIASDGSQHPGLLKIESTGAVYWSKSRLSSDQGGSIELGANGTNIGYGNPYIDFHFDNGRSEDYNARIINSGDKKLEIKLGIDSQGLLDVHGSAQFSGTVEADGGLYAGYAEVGSATSASAYFGHINLSNKVTDYALRQLSTGHTFLNAASDRSLELRLGDDPLMIMNSGRIQTRGHLLLWPFDGRGIGEDGTAYISARDITSNNSIDLQLRTQNNGNVVDALHIEADGRVGIGTNDPTAFLEIVGQIDNGQVNNNVLHLKSYATDGNRDMLKINTLGLHPYLEIYDYDNEGNEATDIKFNTQGDSWFNGGNFGIGTTTPTVKLDVRGNVNIAAGATSPSISSSNLSNFLLWVEKGIVSEDLAIADKTDWADYVFEESYELTSLEELNAYVNREKHLPGIPGVEEIQKKNYYMVHEMLKGQLKNLEEQVLHNIRQEKRILEQEEVIQSLLERIEKLEADRDQ
ncbi:MAG: hypothetical protein AAF149_24295 [Bacteroidota bacterium]